MSWITIRTDTRAVFTEAQIKSNHLKALGNEDGQITAWSVVLGGGEMSLLSIFLIHRRMKTEDEADLSSLETGG